MIALCRKCDNAPRITIDEGRPLLRIVRGQKEFRRRQGGNGRVEGRCGRVQDTCDVVRAADMNPYRATEGGEKLRAGLQAAEPLRVQRPKTAIGLDPDISWQGRGGCEFIRRQTDLGTLDRRVRELNPRRQISALKKIRPRRPEHGLLRPRDSNAAAELFGRADSRYSCAQAIRKACAHL